MPSLKAFFSGLRAGEEYRLARACIVSPYLSAAFLGRFLARLAPASVLVVVDETASDAALARVEALLRARRAPGELRFAASRGLMHASLYYLVWEHVASGETRRVLFWGSANPSLASFSRDAETLSWLPVDPARHPRTVAYFERLAQSTAAVAPVRIALGNGGSLRLPKLAVRAARADVASFDAWLQRGLLCHPFQADPGFLRFTLKLRVALPHGPHEDALRALGFVPDAHSQVLRFRYIESSADAAAESRAQEKWRARYFLESNLGAWSPSEWQGEWRPDAHGPAAALRHEELDLLRHATEIQRNLWIDAFLDGLRRAASTLGDAAVRYLHAHDDGSADLRRYRALAAEQLARDTALSRRAAFRERYTTGYEFIPVPPFRYATPEWSRFAHSLAERLAQELARTTVQNKLARAVLRLCGGEPLDGVAVLRWLRREWPAHHAELSRAHLAG